MRESFPAVRVASLAQLENESVVRDFLEILPSARAGELATFLHPDVRFEGGDGAVAAGRPAVLQVWTCVVAQFDAFRFEVISAAATRHAVFVEQRVHVGDASRVPHASVLGLATFDVEDAQIVGWRQLFG